MRAAAKRALWIGGGVAAVAAVGGIAYAASKPASTTPPAPTPNPASAVAAFWLKSHAPVSSVQVLLSEQGTAGVVFIYFPEQTSAGTPPQGQEQVKDVAVTNPNVVTVATIGTSTYSTSPGATLTPIAVGTSSVTITWLDAQGVSQTTTFNLEVLPAQ